MSYILIDKGGVTMNIIGKWKVRELLFPADDGTVSYTPDNLPDGDCADEIIMMLTNRIEFTEDGLMNTLMRVAGRRDRRGRIRAD